jgi:hypothetical protein
MILGYLGYFLHSILLGSLLDVVLHLIINLIYYINI